MGWPDTKNWGGGGGGGGVSYPDPNVRKHYRLQRYIGDVIL